MKTLTNRICDGKTRTERKILNAVVITIIVTLYITFIPICVSAQEEKSYTKKGSKGELKYSEYQKKNKLIVSNVNYDDVKIRKEYDGWYSVDRSFSGFRMDIQNQFVTAFNKSFSKDKLEILANAGETIKLYFDVDQDGKHLGMWFVLTTGTQVTADELLTLEQNLRELIIFTPIRKAKGRFFSVVNIRTNFKEIFNGEISSIKKSQDNQKELEQILNKFDDSSKE